MTEPSRAVFLSYASQDAEAAKRICEALRAAGIEVWFDQSELRGGDVWDQTIRKQIKACALFIPVISRHTHERREGYFRLEWKLAVDRSNLISATQAFLLPVVIDDTREDDEEIPERIRDIHWTRLPAGETPAVFVERVQRLLLGDTSIPSAQSRAVGALRAPRPAAWSSKRGLLVAVVVALLGTLGYFAINKLRVSQPAVLATATVAAKPAPVVFAPPPHSIAVLPFVNMSGDKEQEYFSDGLTEEILNSLARINELQVAARTSAFSFKGKDVKIDTIARELNVGAVLEGSVRRSGNTIRITAQLNNANTGFHLWSQTYDRDLSNVLQLQTEIANAVANALKVTLLGDVAAKIEVGGTRNPAAFDAYLRGLKLARAANTAERCDAPTRAFSEAISADPNYALAYASRSLVRWDCATYYTAQWLQQAVASGVRSDAARAIELAPGLAAGYVAMSNLESGLLRFSPADEACTRALVLAPNNDQVIYYCSQLAVLFGRTEAALDLVHRGVALDPLNPLSYRALGEVLRTAHRYNEAIAAYQRSIDADPEHAEYVYAARGVSYYLAGKVPEAQASCEVRPDYVRSLVCRAIVYGKLGRQRDASAALAALVARDGDGPAYQYAEIHTQWNDHRAALDWLDKAKRLGDPGLIYLRTDPMLDPLRKDPRFQAIEQALKFPD